MATIKKISTALILIYFAFTSDGCILDSFKTLPVNVATSIEFGASDIYFPSFPMNGEYCMSESSDYMRYINDIKKITYIGMIYRTTSVSPGLKANMLVTLTFNGVPFFSKTFTNFSPGNYSPPNRPLKFKLSQESKNLLNKFLNDSSIPPDQKCFEGTANVEIIDGTQPYSLNSVIDVALQLDTKF